MPENYSNPKITNPIIPPQPSEYIEEDTETVQEPKNDGGNDKPTPKPDNEKPQPKPDDESHHEEEAPKPEEDAPKPEETEPKEEDEDGRHKDEEEGGLEEQNPIEDKDDAQGNFFEDNKGLLTRVYNILKLRFPNSNVSLPQLLTGAQQYIDMIAAPPGGGGQGGGQPTGTGQGQNQAATIKPEDIKENDLKEIIKKYNAINIASSKRFFEQYLEAQKDKNDTTKITVDDTTKITVYEETTNQEIKTYKEKNYTLKEWIDEESSKPVGLYSIITKHDIDNISNMNILKGVISDFCNYVVVRSNKSPDKINSNIEFLMYIYDYLTETLSNSSEDTTLFKSFTTKTADCSHFAYAVVFLCCYANHIHKNNKYITIDYVTWGVYNNGVLVGNSKIGHLFNSTKIDNEWYYIDVSARDLNKHNHKYFLFQDASEYNNKYKEIENRKSIGTIKKLRYGIKLNSINSANEKSQAFLEYFTKNKLISVKLEEIKKNFKKNFFSKFYDYPFSFSNSSLSFTNNIALFQIGRKTLHIVFRFDSSSFDINNIDYTSDNTDSSLKDIPLFFIFIIWLTEEYPKIKNSIIEFICYNCKKSKKEPIHDIIENKYTQLSAIHIKRHKCNDPRHVASTYIIQNDYYYSIAINIIPYLYIPYREDTLSRPGDGDDNSIGAFSGNIPRLGE